MRSRRRAPGLPSYGAVDDPCMALTDCTGPRDDLVPPTPPPKPSPSTPPSPRSTAAGRGWRASRDGGMGRRWGGRWAAAGKGSAIWLNWPDRVMGPAQMRAAGTVPAILAFRQAGSGSSMAPARECEHLHPIVPTRCKRDGSTRSCSTASQSAPPQRRRLDGGAAEIDVGRLDRTKEQL
jgi:hypothetical protein